VPWLRRINSFRIGRANAGTGGITHANRIAFTTRELIGVVVSISAFNHPLNLVIHQTVTAFAAGCPVVIKPATTTPLFCLAFVALPKEAGMPEDWCQAAVMVNDHTAFRVDWMPFGGRGSSGLGMGGIPYSIHEMTREKLMVIKNPGL
jgi:acyl-CoA reductase-like NAD-dependent aldehyde dehydrogenase